MLFTTRPPRTAETAGLAPAREPKRRGAAPVPVSELPRRAAAAAAMAMGNRKVYTDQDRADCAAELVAATLAAHPGARCDCGAPPRWHRRVVEIPRPVETGHYCDRHRAPGDRPLLDWDGAVPAAAAEVTRLFYLACNLRRSLDRQRDRDAQTAAETAATTGFVPPPAEDSAALAEATAGPAGARAAALAALAAIGIRSDSPPPRRVAGTAAEHRRKCAEVGLLRAVHGPRPAGSPGRSVTAYLARVDRALWTLRVAEAGARERRPATWRPVAPLRKRDTALYVLAYTAIRCAGPVTGQTGAAAGAETAAAAEELALAPDTAQKHRARAVKRLAYGTVADWADALALPPGGTCAPHSAGLPESAFKRVRPDLADGTPGDVFPNVHRRDCDCGAEAGTAHRKGCAREERRRYLAPGEHRTAPGRKVWTTVPASHRRTADWAAALAPRTASRLTAAARISRQRAAVKAPHERAAARTTVGLPAEYTGRVAPKLAPRTAWTPPSIPAAGTGRTCTAGTPRWSGLARPVSGFPLPLAPDYRIRRAAALAPLETADTALAAARAGHRYGK